MSLKDVVILGCSSQQPTRHRNHGAYLLRWHEEGFLFDPGEGTQRQFIFAEIAPTVVSRIFISHFHGDHCLGLGSMLMRLNLDKVTHPIHCYYPASGKKHFDRLRYGCIYHENINVIEHPVTSEGIIHQDETFSIEAFFLEHGIDNIGWRITEADMIKFDKKKLETFHISGPSVRKLAKDKKILSPEGKLVHLEEVSWIKKGDIFAVALDSRPCEKVLSLANNATILLCESTYLDQHKHLAEQYMHMTCKQAALIAQKAHVKLLILTHFSARYSSLEEFEKEAKSIFPNVSIAEDFKKIPFPS